MASSPSLANSYSTRNNEGCPTEDNTLRIYNSQSFIGREQPFILNHLYIGENIDELRFRAGSYSGYGEWREKLAELAGYTPIQYNPQYKPPFLSACASAWNMTEGPFWELINFSDCEGTLGTIVCRKLTLDFEKYQSKASQIIDPHDRFITRYNNWYEACKVAGDNNGCIQFH